MSMQDKIDYYAQQGQGVLCLPYELGAYITQFNMLFNSNGEFVGLQPKASQ